jgi:hypothetical protein
MRFECFSQRLACLCELLAFAISPSCDSPGNAVREALLLAKWHLVAASSDTGQVHLVGYEVVLSWVSYVSTALGRGRARASVSGSGAMLQAGRSRV